MFHREKSELLLRSLFVQSKQYHKYIAGFYFKVLAPINKTKQPKSDFTMFTSSEERDKTSTNANIQQTC